MNATHVRVSSHAKKIARSTPTTKTTTTTTSPSTTTNPAAVACISKGWSFARVCIVFHATTTTMLATLRTPKRMYHSFASHDTGRARIKKDEREREGGERECECVKSGERKVRAMQCMCYWLQYPAEIWLGFVRHARGRFYVCTCERKRLPIHSQRDNDADLVISRHYYHSVRHSATKRRVVSRRMVTNSCVELMHRTHASTSCLCLNFMSLPRLHASSCKKASHYAHKDFVAASRIKIATGADRCVRACEVETKVPSKRDGDRKTPLRPTYSDI